MAPESTHWATRRQAAAALSKILGEDVALSHLKRWSAIPGCPIPVGAQPIPINDLISWCLNERRAPGRPRSRPDTEEEARLRTAHLALQVDNLRLRNSIMEGGRVDSEVARVACVRAVVELRHDMTEDLPSDIAAKVRTMPQAEGVQYIRERIFQALDRMQRGALADMGMGP